MSSCSGALEDENFWVHWIDVASPWHGWAIEQLQTCSEWSVLHFNVVIQAGLLIPAPSVGAPDALLDVSQVLR